MKILQINNYQNQTNFGVGTLRVNTGKGWVTHAADQLGHVCVSTTYTQAGVRRRVVVAQKGAREWDPALIELEARDSGTQTKMAQEMRDAITEAENGQEVRFDSIG